MLIFNSINIDDIFLAFKTITQCLPVQLGWFRRSGGGRIYAVLTDKSSVVYLPTTGNYAMLLSIREPDALLEALGRP